jgi:hypothetical protein
MCNRALFLLLLGRQDDARAQYEEVLPLLPDEDCFRSDCVKDLEDALARHSQNGDIRAALEWLPKRWEQLHPHVQNASTPAG